MDPIIPSGLTNFVARQPILDRSQRVIGYELLFRTGVENCFGGADQMVASRSIIDKSLVMGIDVLCEGQRAFINCTQDVVLNQLVSALPPETTVLEILEGIAVTDEIVAACQALWLVAEKVESKEEFEQACAIGFTHFQGYFFAKPAMIGMREVPAINLNRLRMLQTVSNPDLDYDEIESVIKSDAALCYRLLRYLNSALFALPCTVSSVRHALTLLGDEEIRRWATLMIAVTCVEKKPAELLRLALLRARFCESVAVLLKWRGSDLFLLGLFSLMDAILEMPMTELLGRVSLPEPICQALLGNNSGLSQIMALVTSFERADWNSCRQLANLLGVDESAITRTYLESVAWTREFANLAERGDAKSNKEERRTPATPLRTH